MPNQPKSDKTAADLLAEVGRALFDDAEDWQSRLAATLEVRRDSVRKWLHGTIHLRFPSLNTIIPILLSGSS